MPWFLPLPLLNVGEQFTLITSFVNEEVNWIRLKQLHDAYYPLADFPNEVEMRWK